MTQADKPLSGHRGSWIRHLYVVAEVALIGVLLRVVGFSSSLWGSLVFSECIGLSIYSLSFLVFRRTARGSALRWLLLPLALFAGGTFGQILASLVTGSSLALRPALYSKSQFIGLFFGGLGALAFFMQERYWALEARLREREMQHLEAEKRGLEAHLKLLQAQIEPHFLFNSLANVAGLIDPDPRLASRLLEALIRYLRASLQRTRAEGGTLGDELDLLQAYLDIFRIRLGARLDYSVAVAPGLRALPFPPMLMQPLVENAIRHGIEPQVAGGRIDIAATRRDGTLELTVRDTGGGFAEIPGSGFGLENVRTRLAALFGTGGSLHLVQRPEGGVLATLRLPA